MIDFSKRSPESFLNELNARNAQKVIDKWNNSAKTDEEKDDLYDENNQDNDQSASFPEDFDQADESVQNHGTVKIDAASYVADVTFSPGMNLLNSSWIMQNGI